MNANPTTKQIKEKVDYTKCFANYGSIPVCQLNACSVLTEPLCKTQGKCPFFKTREQVDTERKNSKIRLVELGLDEIYDKQYKAAM